MKIYAFFIVALISISQVTSSNNYNHKFKLTGTELETVPVLLSIPANADPGYNPKFPISNAEITASAHSSEALIANDITLTNLMSNGSFESWNTDRPAGILTGPSGTTFTYEQSTDKVVGTHSLKVIVAADGGGLISLRLNDFKQPAGNLIYVGMWCKTSKKLSKIALKNSDDYPEVIMPPYESDNWEWTSYVGASPSNSTSFYLRPVMPGKLKGDNIQLDGVYIIDLTETFGAGNEPSALDMDYIIHSIPYFENTNPQIINDYPTVISAEKAKDPIISARKTRLNNNIFRVATFNTKSDYIYPKLTHRFISELDVDMYSNQECAKTTDPAKSFDVRIDNKNLQFSHYWARTIKTYGWDGLGQASAFEMLNIEDGSLPKQGYIKSTIKIAGQNVSFYTVHLVNSADNTTGRTKVQQLWDDLISKDKSDYIIVAGDFNTPKYDNDITVFAPFLNNGFTSAQGATHGWYGTFKGLESTHFIDNVLVKGFDILKTGKKDPSIASDHYAFWAEIQLKTDSKTDLTPPVLKNVPADKNLGNNPELPKCNLNVTATGGCSEATVICTPGAIKENGCNRSQTFTYTATDACGNTAKATTTYTWIEDLTPPVLAKVPADKDLGNNPELPGCDLNVTATDNCSEVTVTCSPGEIIKEGNNRSQTFTYSATDDCGNTTSATTTYTWTETVIDLLLAGVPADEDLGYNPELPTCDLSVTATGGCSEATVVCTPGAIKENGCNRSQTFTYTATDACGNTAKATTTYTWIEDLTPPVLAKVPADKDLGNNPELPGCDLNVTATDNCSEVTVTCSPGEIIKEGNNRSQTFTYSATDDCGNTTLATTTYTWTETVIDLLLAGVSADEDLGCNPELPTCDLSVTATGGCSEATVVCTPSAIKENGCNRSQTFTYTATDACGNTAKATTTYTWIEDLTPPVLANVPADKDLGNNPELPTCDAEVTAADQCSEATVVCTPGTIKRDRNNRSQTFLYTATDACGNTATGTTIYTWTESINAPVPDFAAANNRIKEGETVQIEDLSDNNPESWTWKFEGGTPKTSSRKNPEVRYDKPGKYSVTLTVTNAGGSDTKTVENFITVEEDSMPDDIATGDGQVPGQTFYVKLYPNPVVQKLVIEMNSDTTGGSYSLYNVNGVKLKTDKILSERTVIDLAKQAPGVYLMVIEKGNKIFRELIVKQ